MSEVYWIIIDQDVREAIPERKGGKDLEVCSCYGEFLCRYNSGRIGMTYIHGSETKLINKTTSTILTGKTKVAGRKQAMCKSK